VYSRLGAGRLVPSARTSQPEASLGQMASPPYTAGKIAQWFAAWAATEDEELSNLKIQKLLYYAQGYHLALRGTPLFNDQLQAWSHGPVVPTVYRQYKNFGSQAVPLPPDDEFSWDDIDPETTDLLIEVWDDYGGYSAWKLRDMTHTEQPWKSSFSDDEAYAVISRSSMKRFFGSRLTRSQ